MTLPAIKSLVFSTGALSVSLGTWTLAHVISSQEPIPKTIEEAGDDVSNASSKLKGTGDNKKYLVSASFAGNEAWWNWVFENRFVKEEVDSHFQKVTKGYSAEADSGSNGDTNQTALNQACSKAYDKDKSSFTNNSTPNLPLKSVQLLCTYGGNKPIQPLFSVS